MKLAVISMDAEFDGHINAPMYAKLGRPNLIFDDDEIPHHLQQRVYNYVTGEGVSLLSLPESATSGDWLEDLEKAPILELLSLLKSGNGQNKRFSPLKPQLGKS